jgi:hypothetical protein
MATLHKLNVVAQSNNTVQAQNLIEGAKALNLIEDRIHVSGMLRVIKEIYDKDTTVLSDYNKDFGYYEKVTFENSNDIYQIDISNTKPSKDYSKVIKKITHNTKLNEEFKFICNGGLYSYNYKTPVFYTGRKDYNVIKIYDLVFYLTNPEVLELQMKYKLKGQNRSPLCLNHTYVDVVQSGNKHSVRPIKGSTEIHPFYLEPIFNWQNHRHGDIIFDLQMMGIIDSTVRKIRYTDAVVMEQIVNSGIQNQETKEEIVARIDAYYKERGLQPYIK